MIELLLLLPVALSILMYAFKHKKFNSAVSVCYSIIYLLITFSFITKPAQFTVYFAVDALNLLFLTLLAILYLGVSLYSLSYIDASKLSPKDHTIYFIFLLLFVTSMTGALLSTHLGLLWVFIEATTLTSSYLIYFNKNKSALEAAWKYIFICSIGIAISYVGIILISFAAGNTNSLFFSDLYANASQFIPFWLKLAFVFTLMGFGTKMGLAPVHAWLPDAHSEAPSPVSALLSGALLNTSFLAILRVFKIMELANMAKTAQILLLIMGMLSILISAVFIMKAKNYKRMLAYSSIENMGIIVLGIGSGGIGYFAALLQLIAHSFAKAAFFLTSGNILKRYNSKKIENISAIMKKDTMTGWLWIICFGAIIGLPPLPAFFSEFLILRSMIEHGYLAIVIVVLLLFIFIIYGMGTSILKMLYAKGNEEISDAKLGILYYLPQIAFIVILVILGTYMPEFVYEMIKNAASAI
ncbi:MAG: hydrogenase [Candidatus Margulisiibacteriota bacterium]|nr:MAG: hypothetical protein A2X43_07355 [Candidatus Margulisbacteria bacterium GWD2_39_127]OGI01965.1 MAG: hypothetical protein A2X42_09810 [Candidatus Margulisbacteria bacterium GWF2_38_17]PZM77281.1 MAG: hydrogenase [Candidatus Margulisiibacteriota bacterium]HAR62920.1 hydrogenase [Candidatus Margulisiibacteriota bacterium]HCT85927.1 hydrogenase [Candidatus Margulisiibacteriota bacterium]